jgi:hypothetical protein
MSQTSHLLLQTTSDATESSASSSSSDRSTGASPTLPSYYEMYMIDNLDDMIQPALDHVLHTLQDQSTSVVLHQHGGKLLSALKALLQWKLLFSQSSTIPERVFGLHRVRIVPDEGGSGVSDPNIEQGHVPGSPVNPRIEGVSGRAIPLDNFRKYVSLAVVVALPQLSKVMKEWARERRASIIRREAQHIEEERASNENARSFLWSVSRAADVTLDWVASAVPPLQSACSLAVSIQQLRYLTGHSPYWHPISALFNIALVRPGASTSPEMGVPAEPTRVTSPGIDTDVIDRAGREDSSSSIRDGSVRGSGRAGPGNADVSASGGTFASFLPSSMTPAQWAPIAVVSAVVGIKLLDWWLKAEVGTGGRRSNIPEFPSPPQLAPSAAQLIPPEDSRLCPLCRLPRRNPCVSATGFVFCFACLSGALSRKPVCPISGQPCSPEDTIRLYENVDD